MAWDFLFTDTETYDWFRDANLNDERVDEPQPFSVAHNVPMAIVNLAANVRYADNRPSQDQSYRAEFYPSPQNVPSIGDWFIGRDSGTTYKVTAVEQEKDWFLPGLTIVYLRKG